MAESGQSRILDISLDQLAQGLTKSITDRTEIGRFSVCMGKLPQRHKKAKWQVMELDKFRQYYVTECYRRTLHENDNEHLVEVVDGKDLQSVHFDLSVGYGEQTGEVIANEFISLLLQSLKNNDQVGSSDFVCTRHLLVNIASAPYDEKEKLKVIVQKIDKTYYMYEDPRPTEDWEKEFTYWGKKFESYVTRKPGMPPTSAELPLHENSKCYSVQKIKLGSHSVIFRADIDCCLPGKQREYIELKTSIKIGRYCGFNRERRVKWWLQSHLLGVKYILCGYRDDYGVVRECEWYEVREIPTLMAAADNPCNTKVCLNFLDKFLTFVRSTVEDEHAPHVITKHSEDKRFEMRIDKTGSYKFLPLWFVKHVFKTKQNKVVEAGGASPSKKEPMVRNLSKKCNIFETLNSDEHI